MADPIQPAGEFYVYSVEEVKQMAPSARIELIKSVSQYIAEINPYAPMPPNPEGVAKMSRVFAELVERQKHAEKASAWEEGWSAHFHQTDTQRRDPSHAIKCDNPYRSES